MAFRAIHHRFTVFDAMDARGEFAKNPANVQSVGEDGSQLYRGPVEYPKMLFHPKGEERIVKAAEMAVTSRGDPITNPDGTYKMIGEQRELIYEIVANAKEEKRLRLEGWHDNPADAIYARTGILPPKSPAGALASKDAEIAKLKRDLAIAKGEVTEDDSLPSDLPTLEEAIAS